MTLYLRLAAYLGAVLLCMGAGYWLGGQAPKRALAQLQAQDWQTKAQANQVAYEAVLVQLKTEQAVSANNSTVIKGLQDANTKIAADRDTDLRLARGLLNSAAKAASSPDMSKTASGPAVASPGGASGDGPLVGLLADAREECARNSARLNALSAQISPQL